jgi:hypothetical protein
MFRHHHLFKILFCLTAVSAVLAVTGCAAKKNPWGDPDSGLILQYRMQENPNLKYQVGNDFTMNMEIMGQPVEIKAQDTLNFSARFKEATDTGFRLGMTIDGMTMDITGPQGSTKPDMGGVIGQTFDMTLSPLGKEGDLAGAEAIKYEVAPGQEYNLAPKFEAHFPDLPDRPVKIGDTWPSSDHIKEGSSKETIHIRLESVNTLEGFETIDGRTCARIKADVTGRLEGTGKEGAMDLVFDGDIKATDIWYFDYQQGVFVGMNSTGTADGTIKGSGPAELVIPMTRAFTMEVKLVD